MLKRIIIIIVILSSLKFYQLAFIPEVVTKVSEWLGIFTIWFFLLVYIIYSREKQYSKHFSFPIILIFISVGISMIGAYAFNDQSFMATAYGQRVIYFYFLYFLLHYMKVPGEFLIKTIVTFALIYLAIYFVQYVIFPIQITNSKMFIDRGTLRIYLSGSGYLVISYFIWLYLTFRLFKIKYVVFLLLALGGFVMLGTRQVIASIVLLTILFVLQSRVIKSKILLFTLIGLAFVPVYFLFQDIFYAMFEVTLEQSQAVESNIRVRATEFFLSDFMRNNLAYFTGNGATGPSLYTLRLDGIAEDYGFYLSDIGLIGEYVKYGIIYVIAVFIILYRSLSAKLPEKLMFIKYNFLGIILTLVTGGGAFGGSGTNIVIICILLYIIDLYYNDEESLQYYPVNN